MLKEVQEVRAKGRVRRVHVQPFAWNLRAPTHMEWSPDGRLFVVERTTGKIKDASKGGDLEDAPAVVEGLAGPSSMAVLPDGRMLVTEFWGGRIREIKEGFHASKTPAYASDLPQPYSLAVDALGRATVTATVKHGVSSVLLVSEGNKHTELVSYVPSSETPGFEGFTPADSWPDRWDEYVAGCGSWGTDPMVFPELPYPLVVSVGGLGRVVGVGEEGGAFYELPVLARGLGYTGGMIANRADGLLYLTQPLRGEVRAIDVRRSANYRFDPPVVSNLPMASCVRFDEDGEIMFVCSPANGVIWKVEGAVAA